MITAGIDCGAKNTKTIILKDGKIVGSASVLTGFDQEAAVTASVNKALTSAGMTLLQIEKIGGTGSGKNSIKLSGIMVVNNIKSMAKGAFYFFPNARTVADVGAEGSRAAKLDDTGNPIDFAVNEKCAAGAGAFIEAMARVLETPLKEIGPMALTSNNKIPMNAQCAIFAESEVVGLIHAKTAHNDISKAIHDSIAGRIVSMIRRIGISEDVVLIGGVGYNPGFVEAMRRELNLSRIYTPDAPEYGAALGAAMVVSEEA